MVYCSVVLCVVCGVYVRACVCVGVFVCVSRVFTVLLLIKGKGRALPS